VTFPSLRPIALSVLALTACAEMRTVEIVPQIHSEPRNAVLSHDEALGRVMAYVEASAAQNAKDARLVVQAAALIETARSQRKSTAGSLGERSGAAVTSSGSVNGYPCGGALPSCCTLQAESRGQPTAQNPVSSSSGLWQFTHDTWAGYGGYSEAKYAPASVQNERAAQVFAGGRGASNWFGDGCYGGR
jgi:hypothetical protein